MFSAPRLIGSCAAALTASAVLGLLSSCDRSAAPPATVPAAVVPATPAPPYFEKATGITFAYRNGEEADHYAILESLGGGAALFDYDGDGNLDVFLAGGGFFDGADKKTIRGHSNSLYRNLGGWKFGDVTDEAGLASPPFYSHGVAVADYDCDGWPDLLVTGYGGVALYRNTAADKGRRRFVDVTEASGLGGDTRWATSAAWGDLDGDGFPDLYVCNYVDWSFKNHILCQGYTAKSKHDVCPPAQYASIPHRLYRNDAKGRFIALGKEHGLRALRADGDYGKGLGALIVDLNGDRKPEIYVANDTTDNFLYVNKSVSGKISLIEQGRDAGVARDHNGVSNGSMGLDAADFDGSGRPALWVTNFENELHALYRNLGRGDALHFVHVTELSGIAAIGQVYVGFGTAFVDFDNDGWEDLFITNGHVMRHPYRNNVGQPPVLLRNTGGGRFENATPRGGAYAQAKHRGRGLARGDFDNDGRLDLVVTHLNQPVSLLRNVADTGHHWLGCALAARQGRDCVGAKLILTAGKRKLTRFVKGGGSYLSANDPRVVFGLGGDGHMDELEVAWPSGSPATEVWRNLPVDRYHKLKQGSGTQR